MSVSRPVTSRYMSCQDPRAVIPPQSTLVITEHHMIAHPEVRMGRDFLSRAALIALLIVVILALVRNPHGGAHAAHSIASFFNQAANAVSSILDSL